METEPTDNFCKCMTIAVHKARSGSWIEAKAHSRLGYAQKFSKMYAHKAQRLG